MYGGGIRSVHVRWEHGQRRDRTGTSPAGSGPFKGGKAIVTVNAYHDTDNCPYGGCGGGGSAGATTAP